MALDMFMKMSNGIAGESKDKDKATVGDIDVLAWSWGVSQSGTFHSGGGGGAGKANVQDLSFTKWIDKASPPLQLACLKGTHLTSAELNVRKAGDKPYVYVKITMTKVLVSSVSTGGSGGEDRLTENVTLNFAKLKIEYFEQGDTGAATAAGDYTFNVEENAAE
ncbi:type VI secretion system tube protein Hcp [Sandarakinorhabdus sp.]|uniref:Hcp family type VI secretion system effector n=1 Tax=Sandarakinorhabdus sp. TaxID=1916663 RepID=UPI00286E2E5A|nr:type VI secretion system tube protein Hcp [Sandarakinorhabdus sp.]